MDAVFEREPDLGLRTTFDDVSLNLDQHGSLEAWVTIEPSNRNKSR